MIEFEGEFPKEPAVKYPRCIDGKNTCPPEDIGGIPGYENLKAIVANPNHPEYESTLKWLGLAHFDPFAFAPKSSRFDSPPNVLKYGAADIINLNHYPTD
ncbi:plasmid pRiA4b ORF-3 family protein [Legionella londiniensis]|uniref:Plasmid pRiA4b ORF-3-like protein n=1 Tax=Legionella londiniensis TaxID=45068 RepID=A0A0W0VNV4_9GAMM|nr:plasmid pRiA4b ORF-3 family protein [Legionella londiniensis]KTD21812.1 Plasmid pRiA4b ORF-3-like protein [Legionella londiniensis]STX92705.1 Plasmid pRiA4b ORF-3-like protein [Legionella londiniensis]